MLSHNISPIIFRIGFIQLTWYALVYIIGFLAGLFLLLRAARKKEIGLKENEVYDLMFWGILGLMIGARLFHILFWGFHYYFNNPIKMLYFWEGGMSFHGGLVGTLLAFGIYCKLKKVNFWQIADILAFLGVLMPVFSRIANFINQEIVGTITNVPWCFKFKYDTGCRHPVQLYASAGRLVFFFFMLYMKKTLKKYKEGFFFWTFIFGVGVGRFVLDFWREDAVYFGLKAGQWLALIMILIGGFVLIKSYKKEIKGIFIKS
jgi:phosphatidylglycerol---prolipoprotein diacylglyceryl transferase